MCVIDRSKWARFTRGVNKGISLLLNRDGNLCCLGFLGRVCAISDASLSMKSGPAELFSVDDQRKYPADVNWNTFMRINDNLNTTDAEKEAKLMELALANGFEFRFEGK